MIARPAMTPAPAMQREAIRRTVIAILAALLPIRAVRPIRSLGPLPLLRRRLRLAAGDEGRQPFDVFVVGRLEVLLPGLVMRLLLRILLRLLVRLLVVLWLRLLRLLVLLRRLLLALIVGLLLRRERLAAHGRLVIVAVVKRVVGVIAALLRLLLLIERRLGLPKVFLRGGDQAEIMLGVLVVVFCRDRIAGALRIAGQLQVFLGNVRGIAPDLQVRSIGLVHARQWILVMVMMMTTATTTFTAVATPHALVLTVSHDLLFRQPPFAAALMPPFLFIDSLFSGLPFSPCVTQCCRLTAVNRRQMHPINPQRILSNRSPHPRLDRGFANPRYARDCSVQMRANR
jgi:hypothetical protein